METINEKLKEYIEKEVFTKYEKNNVGGHDILHIKYVIQRSFEIIKEFNLDVNYNMVYVVAAFHDIGYKRNPKEHEKESAKIFMKNKDIIKFFNKDQIKIIFEAIEDHRASSKKEARNIYGKIVSSADRDIEVDNIIKRSYKFHEYKNKNLKKEEIIELSFEHLTKKYGENGYAKMYYKDKKYLDFTNEIQTLLKNKKEFLERQKKLIEV